MDSYYELTFLFDKGNKTAGAKIEKYLTSVKADNVKKDDWGVRPLAYPIKKHQEARYIHFMATVEPEKMPDLEKKILLDEEIVRHLIVKVTEKNTKVKRKKALKTK